MNEKKEKKRMERKSEVDEMYLSLNRIRYLVTRLVAIGRQGGGAQQKCEKPTTV